MIEGYRTRQGGQKKMARLFAEGRPPIVEQAGRLMFDYIATFVSFSLPQCAHFTLTLVLDRTYTSRPQAEHTQ